VSEAKKESVTVEFTGPFRDATGERRVELQLPQKHATLRDVINVLSEKYGKNFLDRTHGAHHKLGETTMILVNGKIVMDESELDATIVPEGSRIVFMIPLSGG